MALARRLARSRPDRWMSPWTSPFRDDVLPPSQELLRMMDWPSTMLGSLAHDMEPEQTLGLRETDSKLQVTIAAPGIKPEDINVTIDRGILRIKADSKGELDGWEYQNQIERTIQLPTGSIDTEAVTATHEHGMLSVCIPKIEATESPTLKMIPVQPAKKVLQGKQEEQ